MGVYVFLARFGAAVPGGFRDFEQGNETNKLFSSSSVPRSNLMRAIKQPRILGCLQFSSAAWQKRLREDSQFKPQTAIQSSTGL